MLPSDKIGDGNNKYSTTILSKPQNRLPYKSAN